MGQRLNLGELLAFRRKRTQQEECRWNSLEVRNELRQIMLLKTREVNISKTSGKSSRSQATELNNKVKGNLRANSENWNMLKPESRK